MCAGGNFGPVSRRCPYAPPRISFLRAVNSRRFEQLEVRCLLATSSLVYPGADGHLVYVPDAQGDVIPNFSNVGYLTGDVPLPDTAGGIGAPGAKVTINPGGAGR